MPIVGFREMMAQAERGAYAVGYFESWNLESLLAVADAAEVTRAPVILGFSGIYLPDPNRVVHDALADYAALGLAVARRLTVPCCLLFNESPFPHAVEEAIRLGFGLVMFSDAGLSAADMTERVRQVVRLAHGAGCCVEGEPTPLPGVGGELAGVPDDRKLTEVGEAVEFFRQTGVDALAVNVGQVHLHGRGSAPLDFARLEALRAALPVPLVLHGASSIRPDDIRRAVAGGVRKINVGSTLKQAFLSGMKAALARTPGDANPYEVLGSGRAADVLAVGRRAMAERVIELIRLFGSAGKADLMRDGS